jgi:ubiquinone biosynthesis protein UbiJ
MLREKSSELQRLQVLLNKTREEIAKEYVTKAEVHADINRVLDRLDRLDAKIDRLMEATNGN